MIAFRITAEVGDDKRVVLILPQEVPTGRAELMVTVDSCCKDDESARAAAVEEFLSLARSSSFCSAGLFASRDEFH